MLTIREIIVGKVQSAHGTPATLDPNADAIMISNLQHSYVDTNMISRPILKGTLGTLKQLYAGGLAQISFDVELKGSGTAGSPPEMAHSMVACGMVETIVASTSCSYKPASLNQQYMTFHYYQDGKRKVLEDAIGNVLFKMEAGQVGMASFTFTGHEGTATDTTFVNGAYDATVPVPYINRPFDIGGYAADISNLSFDLANTISKPKSVGASDGFGQLRITARDVAGSFDPLDELIATNDFDADWKAGTTMALATGVVGSTVGNRYQLDMPAVAYRSVAQGDRESQRALDIAFGAAEVSGDDEFTLLFT